MTELEKRALKRRNNITVKKVSLHDEVNHHSFHFDLTDIQKFELLAEMSIKEWETQTGKIASRRVDKTKVRKITLKEKYSECI